MDDRMDYHRYDDVIYRQHPTSKKHPRMSRMNRAAQFAPFAALTGYEESIKETARLTDRRIELSEYEIEELNAKLNFIQEHIKERPEVTITYFQPDERKEGGAYITITGKVRRIDEVNGVSLVKDYLSCPPGYYERDDDKEYEDQSSYSQIDAMFQR